MAQEGPLLAVAIKVDGQPLPEYGQTVENGNSYTSVESVPGQNYSIAIQATGTGDILWLAEVSVDGYPVAYVLVDLKERRSVEILGKSSPQGNFLSRFTWESLEKVPLASKIDHSDVETDPKELEKLGKIEVFFRTVISQSPLEVNLDEQDAGFGGSDYIKVSTTHVRPVSVVAGVGAVGARESNSSRRPN